MKQKWLKRIARAILPCFVFFVFSFSFAPKVYAVEAEVGISYGGNFRLVPFSGQAADPFTYYLTNGQSPVVNGSTTIGEVYGRTWFGDMRFNTYPEATFTGPVKVYISYYPTALNGSASEVGDYMNTDTWLCTYFNAYNQEGVTSDITFDRFAQSASNTGYGYALEVGFQGAEFNAIRALSVKRDSDTVGLNWSEGSGTGGKVMYFPSIRVIAEEYDATLGALDGIADEIAAQSDLLLAMKGEIVGILQDIYSMTGDLWIAQDLTNQYLAAMLPLLEDIDQTTTNIYSLLSSQLRALETAIENAATSIESAISAQTAAMIAYLESVLNTGNEVPDDTYQQQQDAANILDQMESLEKPDVNTVVPEIGDYSDSGVSNVLSAIFSSNLIVTMMTLSASFAFGAYVLFGKRD